MISVLLVSYDCLTGKTAFQTMKGSRSISAVSPVFCFKFRSRPWGSPSMLAFLSEYYFGFCRFFGLRRKSRSAVSAA